MTVWWLAGLLVVLPMLLVVVAAVTVSGRLARLRHLGERTAAANQRRVTALAVNQQRLQARMLAVTRAAELASARLARLRRRLAGLRPGSAR